VIQCLLLLARDVELISCFAPECGAKKEGVFFVINIILVVNIFLSVHRSSQHLQQLNGLALMLQHQDAEVKPCCCIFLEFKENSIISCSF